MDRQSRSRSPRRVANLHEVCKVQWRKGGPCDQCVCYGDVWDGWDKDGVKALYCKQCWDTFLTNSALTQISGSMPKLRLTES
jgi:hypothetical protein